MSFFGPIQLVALGFPSAEIPVAVIDQLRTARETGAVRLVDGVFASKDADGNLVAIEASNLSDEELALLGTLARALFGYGVAGDEGADIGIESGLLAAEDGSFGLTAGDLEGIAEDVPADSAVLFLLIEHQWGTGRQGRRACGKWHRHRQRIHHSRDSGRSRGCRGGIEVCPDSDFSERMLSLRAFEGQPPART